MTIFETSKSTFGLKQRREGGCISTVFVFVDVDVLDVLVDAIFVAGDAVTVGILRFPEPTIFWRRVLVVGRCWRPTGTRDKSTSG